MIGRPVVLEVVKKCGPIVREVVVFEVAQRKRKAVVNPDEGRRTGAQFIGEPFGESAARPILMRAGRRENFAGRQLGRGRVEAQSFQTASGGSCTGIIEAKIAGELRHGRADGDECGDNGAPAALIECGDQLPDAECLVDLDVHREAALSVRPAPRGGSVPSRQLGGGSLGRWDGIHQWYPRNLNQANRRRGCRRGQLFPRL